MHKKVSDYDCHDEFMAHRRGPFGKYENYVPEFVYGGIDGAITTFAVVAASAGAGLSPGIVFILGISNMLADGLSMSVGSFLSTKAELDRYDSIKSQEYDEIEKFADHETDEIRDIYAQKGFEGILLEEIVAKITSDKDLWVAEMMIGEHGMQVEDVNPKLNGLVTFISFCLLATVPILPYIWAFATGTEVDNAFVLACIFTAVAFIIIGALKGYINQTNKIKGIIETLGLGGIAAAVAYFAGDWLEKLII